MAVEIDGSQHEIDTKRKEKDIEKDTLLQNKGWKVLRFTEYIVKTDWNIIKEKLDLFLNTNNIIYEKVGIYKHKKKEYKKVFRHSNGLSNKMIESAYKQRKVINRPSYDDLM